MKSIMELKEKSHVNKEDIIGGLQAVGIGKDDIVFAHSSLSSFGYVEGGADTVIDALLEALGEKGTLVLPTFTWGLFHDKERVTFDLRETPSETGRIPEVFRKRGGVIRSRHICHSVAASGPQAERVMGEGVRSFGRGSTFDRLYELDAWNLFIGVSFGVCTALHMAEEFMQVPYRAYRGFEGSQIILPGGTVQPSKSVEFLRKDGYRNDFAKMEGIFSKEGILRPTTVGQARLINARIRDIFDVAAGHLKHDIGFLLTPESKAKL